MGCFLGCFGSSKDQKRRKQTYKVIPRDQNHASHKPLQTTVSTEQGNTEKPTNSVPELRYTDKTDEQLSLSTRKKVTFDSNIKTYEHVVYESTDSLPEKDKFNEKEKNECVSKSSQPLSSSEDDSITSSVGSYPPNHRYQNCQESDSEVEESDYEDGNSDNEDDDLEEQEAYDYDEDSDARIVCKEVWSESVPTESFESRTEVSSAQVTMEEVKSPMAISGFSDREIRPIGLNRNARDRSVYVHPVLNPVENLTQWKAVKSKGTLPLKLQKENFNADQEEPRISFSSEPSFKQSSFSFKSQSQQPKGSNHQEIAVDASLSNWLVSSETTPNKKASSFGLETINSEISMSHGSPSAKSIEDRPILGALTVEELRQFSANSSPRKSPSKSPDDMPIIGSVGTYWNHKGTTKGSGSASSYKGIPNTNSKYREVYMN
ncbi:hypothetical protein LguiA_011645 [Lonicera macranthoides]